MATGSKYWPLTQYLTKAAASGSTTVQLDFAQIADMVTGGLPPSAYRHRAWWSNDSKVEAQAWREAGWHVEAVSLDRRRVTFARGEVGGGYAARKAAEAAHPGAR
jgi:uncharacterized protein YraI